MRNVIVISILFFSQAAWGQVPGRPRDSDPQLVENTRRLQEDAFEKWSTAADHGKKANHSREAAAAEQFYSKARRFVDLWQAFAKDLDGNKTFNAKLAKQVSKAFHDMEGTDGWPVGRTK